MKKIFTFFAAAMMAANLFAGSYGILVNSNTYFAGTQVDEFEGFVQYLAHVQLKAGDYCQLCDAENRAVWAVDLNPASVGGFTRNGDKYEVSADGCFDFYIKLKYQQDELYIGPGSDCGSGVDISGQGGGDDQGGGQGGGSDEGYWYWKGYVDGQDINSEVDGGIFDFGISHIEVNQDGYIFVVYQVHGVPGVQYMATSYVDGPTHATMTTSGNDKLHVPAGNHTLYLYDNGDGTVELSFEELPGKTLMGGTQGVENVVATDKAHKIFVDGQMRIVRGDKVFDVTGREL